MMTPKEALIKDGTIPVKEGRGRLSRAAVDRCKWLVANKGYVIKGYEVSTSTPAPNSVTPSEPVVNKVKVANVKEVRDFTIFWPEDAYKAVGKDKKIWGMREACNTCRVSLVQCGCGNPTILNNIPVSITRKT